MPMQFDYDEIGDMFTYFMISFGALILTPGMVQFFFMIFKGTTHLFLKPTYSESEFESSTDF